MLYFFLFLPMYMLNIEFRVSLESEIRASASQSIGDAMIASASSRRESELVVVGRADELAMPRSEMPERFDESLVGSEFRLAERSNAV